ncbi:MAG: hypothetical protein J6B90_11660 [Lachnospiraceae bacterium]|nr:hypothetical protein [Lachnospiraceae bacterium]
MITLHLEKLYRYPRTAEHMAVAVPFKCGELTDISKVRVYDEDKVLPVQCKVTARYPDNSVKYLLVRFMGDLPGNQAKEFLLDLYGEKQSESTDVEKLSVEEIAGGYRINNGKRWFQVKHGSEGLFADLYDGVQRYEECRFAGPYLECRKEEEILPFAEMNYGNWYIAEQGPLCVILKNKGVHKISVPGKECREISFETKLTAWAGKPWIEVAYCIINTSEEELDIGALGFYCRAKEDSPITSVLEDRGYTNGNNVYRTKGVTELSELEKLSPAEKIRTCTGYSNYKTEFKIGAEGEKVVETVTAKRMMSEMSEHYAEVLYGTFFVDRTDERGGICATVYQAQQNFPKAVKADRDGLAVMLVSRGEDKVILQPGMSREQRFLLHFHGSEESLAELDNRSLIYQMPDRPVIAPDVFKNAGVMPDIFPDKMDVNAEIMLIRKADGHNRVFGMLNWGDTYDANYSAQGRGGGKPVWSNNEYDYPHACALMYARTGTRRFLDYMLVAASHWMDVDICHYSKDPLRIGGQIEHTRGHVIDGKIAPSHEWVEGLLDYYHFTGDERGLECAIGIGENVLRLLETPLYAKTGEVGARETGWALRTFTVLYVETGEERWLEKCEWIVGHFRKWEEDYGHWLSAYTDNTLIRVGFMISVAVGSLMRYYRICPDKELREMILRAVDDLIENGRLDNGLFYYKELPSLSKLGTNTLLLEAMAIGYELTGDTKYLEAGQTTYCLALQESGGKAGGQRIHVEDAVIWPGESGKAFGQNFLPLASYDRALEKAGMR